MINRQPLTYYPRQMANKALGVYFAAFILVSVLFSSQALPFSLLFFGPISILLFFLLVPKLSITWARYSEKIYCQKLLWMAVGIRAAYAMFIYFFNYAQYNTFYESNALDVRWYVPEATAAYQDWMNGIAHIGPLLTYNVDIGDVGYVVYLACIYTITGGISDVIIPLLIKSIWGGLTCVFMYRIAKNHFGEGVGRMTGLFCALQGSMIWWCGSMMKETEMLFLLAWFACRADEWLTSGRPKPWRIVETFVACGLLFTFRSALAVVAVGSIVFAVLMSDSKVVSWGRKIGTTALLGLVLVVFVGGPAIKKLTEDLDIQKTQENKQALMEWRTKRAENGNKFAKYATATVFAPIIFTIPFPTMVYTSQDQEMQTMVNGGNFEKNLLSFFVILTMFVLLFSGEWRQHVFPIALLCGYLVALVISDFAQSGRFHMPAMPLEMMFAAYGLSLCGVKPKYKRWYNIALFACFFFCLAWNWFKLAGKGLI